MIKILSFLFLVSEEIGSKSEDVDSSLNANKETGSKQSDILLKSSGTDQRNS